MTFKDSVKAVLTVLIMLVRVVSSLRIKDIVKAIRFESVMESLLFILSVMSN